MKKNTRKNWILSLVLAFMMFFGIGASVMMHNASAYGPEIYTKPSANFFDVRNFSPELPDGVTISYLEELYYVEGNEAVSYYNGFSLTFSDDFETSRTALSFDDFRNPFRPYSCLGSISRPGDYIISWDFYVSTSHEDDFFQLAMDSAFPVLGSGDSFSVTSTDLTSSEFISFIIDVSSSSAYAGLRVEVYNIRVNYGTTAYAWEPYYFDVEVAPDSSSSSSSSSSEDISSDDSGSNEGSYSEGYSDGYSVGYSDGYSDGESAGYDNGYTDGLKYAENAYFSNATVLLYVKPVASDLQMFNISDNPDIDGGVKSIYGGLDFSNVYDSYSVNYPDIEYCYIHIALKYDVPSTQFHLLAEGNPSIFMTTDTSTGQSVSLNWLLDNENGTVIRNLYLNWRTSNWWDELGNVSVYVGSLVSPENSEIGVSNITNRLISGITIPSFSSFSYLDGLKVYVSDNQYQIGFEEGQNSINDEVYQSGFTEGQDVGFLQGKDVGYLEGFNKAMSDDPYGFADFMFTALDMPGRIIYNWLNFEFMGVNLAGLVATIITVVIVAFVIKMKPI